MQLVGMVGSGLGLAISSKVINRFSGTITAKNLFGGGLCIHIMLPIVGRMDL